MGEAQGVKKQIALCHEVLKDVLKVAKSPPRLMVETALIKFLELKSVAISGVDVRIQSYGLKLMLKQIGIIGRNMKNGDRTEKHLKELASLYKQAPDLPDPEDPVP